MVQMAFAWSRKACTVSPNLATLTALLSAVNFVDLGEQKGIKTYLDRKDATSFRLHVGIQFGGLYPLTEQGVEEALVKAYTVYNRVQLRNVIHTLTIECTVKFLVQNESYQRLVSTSRSTHAIIYRNVPCKLLIHSREARDYGLTFTTPNQSRYTEYYKFYDIITLVPRKEIL